MYSVIMIQTNSVFTESTKNVGNFRTKLGLIVSVLETASLGIMRAPRVPPLCRETQSLEQQMLNATMGINGLMYTVEVSGNLTRPEPYQPDRLFSFSFSEKLKYELNTIFKKFGKFKLLKVSICWSCLKIMNLTVAEV